MTHPPLNHEKVAELLEALRQRTPREITIAVMCLGGCFSPEMRRALELLAVERNAERFVSFGLAQDALLKRAQQAAAASHLDRSSGLPPPK